MKEEKDESQWLIRVIKHSVFCLMREIMDAEYSVCIHQARQDDSPRKCAKRLCPRFWNDLP